MKFNIFIDSDIILDVLAHRDPFYRSAAGLFTLIENGQVKGYTSPIVFANLFYVLRKRISKEMSLTNLKYLKSLVDILPVDQNTIEFALNSSFNDFEDAIQYYCAEQNGLKYLITRNKKDYKKAKINILDAQEYLSMWFTHNSN